MREGSLARDLQIWLTSERLLTAMGSNIPLRLLGNGSFDEGNHKGQIILSRTCVTIVLNEYHIVKPEDILESTELRSVFLGMGDKA